MVGEDRAAVSTDGWNWDSVSLDWPAYLFGVAFGNGAFIAAGPDAFWQSTDGTNWARSAPHDGSPRRVAFGGGFFVAVTGPNDFGPSQSEGLIWTSSDGVHWIRRHSNATAGLTCLAFGNGTFVALGDDGTILQSDALITLAISMSATPTLSLTGPVNRAYNIECADQSGHWQPFKTVFADTMPFSVLRAFTAPCSPRPSDCTAARQELLVRPVLYVT